MVEKNKIITIYCVFYLILCPQLVY